VRMPLRVPGARALVLATAWVATVATGQVLPPGPGEVLRDTQSLPRPLEPPARPSAPVTAPPLPAPAAAAPPLQLTVKALRFVRVGPAGPTPWTDPELEALAAPLLGRPLGLAELQDLVLRLSEALRARGLLVARAYLPAQQLRDGVLEIGVIEGEVGHTAVDNASAVRDAVFEALLARQLPPGAPITAAAAERAALLAEDLAGVRGTTRILLAPGADVGTSAVTLSVPSGPDWAASVGADNYGNTYTGVYRLNGSLSWFNPLRLGDAVNLLAITSDADLWLARVGYTLPWAAYGLAFDIGYTASNYRLGREFSALGAGGSTQVTEAGVSYALLRRLNGVANLRLRYEGLRLAENPDGRIDLLRTVDGLALRLDGNFWPGVASALGYNLILRRGRVDITNAAAAEFDAATVRTGGNFTRAYGAFNGSYGRGPVTLYGNLQGQWASRNLDPAERMTVTGIAGVRAYAPGFAAASAGWLANLEARYALPGLPGQTQAVAFYDAAASRPLTEPLPRQSQTTVNLAGAGVGLTWFEPFGWQARLYVAWSLGSRPAGVEADSPRYLAQLTKAF
jgi:hemolysin activation/secretion protein